MEYAPHPRVVGSLQKCGGVCFGLSCVQHYWLVQFRGKCELSVEGVELPVTRRMIVVRIEAALPDGHGAVGDRLANRLGIGCVVP